MEIMTFLLCIVCMYIAAIVIYSYVKKVSIKESRLIIIDFLKQAFGFTPTETIYPIFLGLEDGIPNARVIEEYFSDDLNEIFNSFYLADCYIRDNILVYSINIGQLKMDIEKAQLEEYLFSIIDAKMHSYLHKNSPCIGKINNLVAITIDGAYLKIFVATTSSATNIIARYKEHMRQYRSEMIHKQNNKNTKMLEV